MRETWTPVEPLTDEPADRAFWHEPWAPQIGDRVRIRLSGECNRDWQAEGHPMQKFPGHPDELNGRTATVVDSYRPDRYPEHPLTVEFDGPPVVINGYAFQSTRIATAELESLDA